jgi:hypothetical protein
MISSGTYELWVDVGSLMARWCGTVQTDGKTSYTRTFNIADFPASPSRLPPP